MERMSEEQLRELRVVVARAMGWRDVGVGPYYDYRDGTCFNAVIGQIDDFGRIEVPDYPQDPAQIGPMLEHFRNLWVGGLTGRIRWWEIHDYPSGWNVVIKNTRGGIEGSAEAVPTLELAICLAIREFTRAEGTNDGSTE